jgi:neutral ceramidase
LSNHSSSRYPYRFCRLSISLEHAAVFLAAVLLNLQTAPSHGDDLQAGVTVVDITPPVPWRMSGYFYERISTGVKDPLQAKAVVLKQGDVTAAMVFCDLVGVPREVSDRARRMVQQATGIPHENVVIAATHTHTGPLYYGPLRELFHQRAVERSGTDANESIDYPEKLVEQITSAVVKAASELRLVEIAAGVAREDRLAFNRRFHMRDGSVRFNPGQLNPDIVRPAGPIDPDVGLIALKTAGDDEPFAAVICYALHLDTTSGTEYSADYPRFLEEGLRKRFGSPFIALFGAGTCGDVNHIDVRTKEVRRAEAIGGLLAETVGRALEDGALMPVSKPKLAVAAATVNAPLQTYTSAEVDEARKKLEIVGQRKLPFLDEVKAYSIVALQSYEGSTLPLDVKVFRISDDVAIVTLPSEIFVELGLAIKAASPFKMTLVIELANDSLGYIPTKKAFAEGSYETVNSRVQPGVGEMLVETAIKLLKQLE